MTKEETEELRLRLESHKDIPEIIGLRPIERRVRTNAMRRAMMAEGRVLTERDEFVLWGFEKGAFLFEELADHFYTRIQPR